MHTQQVAHQVQVAPQVDDKVMRALDYYGSTRFQGAVAGLSRPHWALAHWRLRLLFWQGFRRAFNCTLALLLLIGAMPIMLVTALAIRLDSPGPAIFSQTRIGKQGKPFTLYKFRSMTVDAEARKNELAAQNEVDGPVFKMKHDPRVTRVGAIIRKLSIDELPQFFNVIKGDMNLVGPRPPLPHEVDVYDIEHLRRLDVVPGITGLAQVMGRSNLDFETWVELDREYIAHQSLRTDLTILMKTVPAVLLRRGAY